ncbi:MAG: endonuclease VIII [Oscillospiraceae bacterium]|nr:endonuclease VIII [Oscillospiraceae bacterium]
MVELPESYVLAEQIDQTLVGKTIKDAEADAHPHKFAWYTDDPAEYGGKLRGKKVTGANPGTGYTCGGNTEILCEDVLLVMNTPIKYHAPGEKLPKKHQLLLTFDNDSHISCTVQMWGSMLCYSTAGDDIPKEYKSGPDPLTEAFDQAYFDALWSGTKQNLSAKAFLATEQRIPGLGNGVLQDILFNAGIHPKLKLEEMGDEHREKLFRSVKNTLKDMRDRGGRDTEKDLFGHNGGYRTILSKNTLPYPCLVCGSGLIRQAFLGGNIYVCPTCQPL